MDQMNASVIFRKVRPLERVRAVVMKGLLRVRFVCLLVRMLVNRPMPSWLIVELEPLSEDDHSELSISLDT